MEHLARNLTNPVEGCLRTAAHLIHDRDPLYTRVFGEILTLVAVSSRFGCHRRVPISTPLPSGSSARSQRSVSVAWSRLARLMCASSSTSSSNSTITRETIRAATTNSCSDRHLRSTRTPTWSGGSASADFSTSTTERPHEWATDYLHLTASAWVADLVLRPLLTGILGAIMGVVAWVSTRPAWRKRSDEYAETVNPTSRLPESIHEAVEAASDEARKRADKRVR